MKHKHFQKAWEILFPFLLYYLSYNAAYLILAFVYQAAVKSFGAADGQALTRYEATISGVAGGLCSLAGIFFLFPMLKKELLIRVQENGLLSNGDNRAWRPVTRLTMTVILAFSVSLGLNAFLTLTGFVESSQTYQQVADHQYGVVFGIGLLLYGLVSPLAEEILFRGVIYNRMRRYFGPIVGIVASGLFFGVFHGNLVQGVYGTVMGILIAYMYERSGKFITPFLFHAAANLAVYITAHVPQAQAVLFTPAGCAALFGVAVVTFFTVGA